MSIRVLYGEPKPQETVEPAVESASPDEEPDGVAEQLDAEPCNQSEADNGVSLNGTSTSRYCEAKPGASRCRSDLIHAS